MFRCEICGKECSSSASFGGHISGHSRLGRKRKPPRVCIVCGKPLKESAVLYCSSKCQAERLQQEWETAWLSGEQNTIADENKYWTPRRIRTYMMKKYNNRCSRCGWGEINPYTNKVPLELEHIDGNYRNNSPENLTILCPNCHSLTKTYKGANKGNGRKARNSLV